MKKTLFILILSFISFQLSSQEYSADYQDGLIVFQFKSTIENLPQSKDKIIAIDAIPFVQKIAKKYGITEVKQLHPKIKDENLIRTYQLRFTKLKKTKRLIKYINKNKQIEYAEQKELHYTQLTPNDNFYTNSFNNGQWALFQINAAQAWDVSTGDPNIIVAITDNAIDITHPDLVGNLIQGRDVVDGNADPSPCGSNTGFHGTHVSGIAGATTNNNQGIASIGFDISIMPIKIGNCNGSLVGGYDGIIWAADNGADVINMSWGGGGQSTYGQNVCTYAWNQGSILVAAAGNDDSSQELYPAAYNNVIAVASTSANDVRSGFSQYGTWVDIAAPGSSILSCDDNSSYQVTQGTSMASPLVAGLVGLMKSHAPSASQQDVVDCLLNTADNIDAANPNYINQLGSGRINAHQALLCMNQYTFARDIGIASIESPSGLICASTVTPEIVLKNYGSNTLNSATISYQYDNGPVQTYNWTGNLSQGQSDTFNLPTQSTLSPGNYTLSVSSSLPNGNTDQNPSNDELSSDFTMIPFGQETVLTIITDCYGSETSWEIVSDATGAIVHSGGPYSDVSGGETIEEILCIESGCYTFNIYDSYGDGMYGSQWSCTVDGDYFLEDENGATIFEMTATNGDFGDATSHNFCVSSNLPLDAGVSEIIYPKHSICNSNIAPSIVLSNYGTQILNSAVLQYSFSGGNQQSFNWSGNLAPGQSTTVVLPSMNISSGSYSFTAEAINPNNGIDLNPINNSSTSNFQVFNQSVSLPFTETFESNSFMTNQWTLDNPDADITWELVSVGGTSPGNTAAKLDFYNYSNGSERDGLMTPPLDFSNYSNVTLYFEHAFRRFNTNSADSLIIYTSTDCGNTFTRLVQYAEDGSGSFATNYTNTTPYSPTIADDWCMGPVGADCFTLDLNFLSGQPSVVIRFESFNDGIAGNNLYLDNININGTPQVIPPNANFSANITSICEDESINFTDQSTYGPTSWLWDFGDGNTSTVQNPVHTYANAGTYTVQLTATNSQGNDIHTESNLITVNPSPTIALALSSDTVCLGSGTVAITASPQGGSLSGTGVTGNTFDPALAGLGTFSITYIYENSMGCSAEAIKTIVVEDCNNTNINTIDFANVLVYPNPNSGQFTINGITKPFKVEVYDIRGRLIQSIEQYTSGTTIDISQNEAGVYFLRLSDGIVKVNKQIVLMR